MRKIFIALAASLLISMGNAVRLRQAPAEALAAPPSLTLPPASDPAQVPNISSEIS